MSEEEHEAAYGCDDVLYTLPVKLAQREGELYMTDNYVQGKRLFFSEKVCSVCAERCLCVLILQISYIGPYFHLS